MITKGVLCVGCGKTWPSEQSYGLHLWQARRRWTKCSPEVDVERQKLERQYDRILNENARIMAALNTLLQWGPVEIGKLSRGRYVWAWPPLKHGHERVYGSGSSLAAALERCAKEMRQGE